MASLASLQDRVTVGLIHNPCLLGAVLRTRCTGYIWIKILYLRVAPVQPSQIQPLDPFDGCPDLIEKSSKAEAISPSIRHGDSFSLVAKVGWALPKIVEGDWKESRIVGVGEMKMERARITTPEIVPKKAKT